MWKVWAHTDEEEEVAQPQAKQRAVERSGLGCCVRRDHLAVGSADAQCTDRGFCRDDCRVGEVVESAAGDCAPLDRDVACEKLSFWGEFPLCLSRACLGKMFVFSTKIAQKMRFRTEGRDHGVHGQDMLHHREVCMVVGDIVERDQQQRAANPSGHHGREQRRRAGEHCS
jgi:hypothetical protein